MGNRGQAGGELRCSHVYFGKVAVRQVSKGTHELLHFSLLIRSKTCFDRSATVAIVEARASTRFTISALRIRRPITDRRNKGSSFSARTYAGCVRDEETIGSKIDIFRLQQCGEPFLCKTDSKKTNAEKREMFRGRAILVALSRYATLLR